jgi:hypothetical protein
MDTQVAVVRGAVKAEVYSKGYRCPSGILLPTVEAYLPFISPSAIVNTETH